MRESIPPHFARSTLGRSTAAACTFVLLGLAGCGEREPTGGGEDDVYGLDVYDAGNAEDGAVPALDAEHADTAASPDTGAVEGPEPPPAVDTAVGAEPLPAPGVSEGSEPSSATGAVAEAERSPAIGAAEGAEPPSGTDVTAAASNDSEAPAQGDALPPDTYGDDAALSALIGEDEIPYPIYPNGEKYRIGGEHGLMIVLFETGDSFEEVDSYYRTLTDSNGMPRLVAMQDYVRYGSDPDDTDPWATHRPGIVIHRFRDESERAAVGAGKNARTNIIMSF